MTKIYTLTLAPSLDSATQTHEICRRQTSLQRLGI